jgi:hypothetical protein
MLHIWLRVDAQAALAAFINLFRNKVQTLNFKTFFKVAAVLAVLLTSSYFLFSTTILNLTSQDY